MAVQTNTEVQNTNVNPVDNLQQTTKKPSTIPTWIRILFASLMMTFCSGISYSYPAIKEDLLQLGIFGRYCPDAQANASRFPCEDQELVLNLMFTITANGAQTLAALSGTIFQIFNRRIYIFVVAAVFTFGVSGFGFGLLLKDVPGLSDFLLFVCYYCIGYSGLSLLLGFLSFQQDVKPKYGSLVSSLINAPWDLSTAVFFLFSILRGANVPLWISFLVYGIIFGLVLFVFGIFSQPFRKKSKVIPNNQQELHSQIEAREDEKALQSVDSDDAKSETSVAQQDIQVQDVEEETQILQHDLKHVEPPLQSTEVASEKDIEPRQDEPIYESSSQQSSESIPSKKPSILKKVLSKIDPRTIIPWRLYLKPEMWIIHLTDTFVISQVNLFSATVLEHSRWVTDTSEQSDQLVTVFNIMQIFVGTILSLLIGPFLSRFHPSLGVSVIFFVCFFFTACSVIPVYWVQYITYFFFFNTRALYFVLAGSLVYKCFPPDKAPFVFGTVLTVSGTLGVGLAFLCNYLAIKVFDGSFLVVFLVMGSCSCFLLFLEFFAVIRLERQRAKRNKKKAQEMALDSNPASSSEDENDVEDTENADETENVKEEQNAEDASVNSEQDAPYYAPNQQLEDMTSQTSNESGKRDV